MRFEIRFLLGVTFLTRLEASKLYGCVS